MVSITSAPVERVDRGDDPLPVLFPGGVDDDVAQALACVDLDQVHGADHPSGVADRAGQTAERARASSILTRMVRRYCALGVALIW